MSDVIDHGLQPVVLRSIAALASACDHALSRDAVGFSKSTAGPGHEIAALGEDRWTPAIWSYASRVAAHHSRQLERQKVINDDERSALQQFAQGRMRSPAIASDWMDVQEIDGKRVLVISVAADKALTSILKRFDGEAYRPAGGGKLWRVSERFAFAVTPFVSEFERLSPEVDGFLNLSGQTASAEDRLLAHNGPVLRLNIERNAAEFIHGYSTELRDMLRESGGGYWTMGKTWDESRYTVYLNANGWRFYSDLKSRLDLAVLPDAEQALAAAKSIIPAIVPIEKPKVEKPILAIENENGVVTVRMTRYVASWVDAIKSVEGRRYVDGAWTVPLHSFSLVTLAKGLGRAGDAGSAVSAALELAEELKPLEASHTPEDGLAPHLPRLSILGGLQDKNVELVMSKFVSAWVSAIKALPKGRRFYSNQSWTIRNDSETFGLLADSLRGLNRPDGDGDFNRVAFDVVRKHQANLEALAFADSPAPRI